MIVYRVHEFDPRYNKQQYDMTLESWLNGLPYGEEVVSVYVEMRVTPGASDRPVTIAVTRFHRAALNVTESDAEYNRRTYGNV
jgi:hypothetical protein